MGVYVCLLHQTHTHPILSEMASKVLLASLLAVSSGLPVAQYAPAPEVAYPDIAPSYNYQFGVNDPEYSGAVFSHQENREDYNTAGEYRVNLPDGRVQIVSYTAGPEGYVADVRYEGEAVYPDEPAYKPAPAYSPAPAPYAPAPVVKVAPAPVVKVAPVVPVVKAAPVVPVVKAAPVVVKAAPVVVKAAPVTYKPAPVFHQAPVYHKTPVYHKPTSYAPRKYGYSVVTTTEAAPAEVKEAPAPVEVEAEEAPAPAPDAPAATEAAPAAEEARRYRYY